MKTEKHNFEIASFRITQESKRRLKEKAAKHYRPMSIELRYIIDLYLDGKLIPADSVSREDTKTQEAGVESNVG